MTAFLDLTDAVVAALEAPPAIADVVRRGRDVPVPANAHTAIDVHMAGANGDLATLDGEELQWAASVGIDLYARAVDGMDAEEGIDELLGLVFARMTAAVPPAGVVAWAMAPSVQWAADEADQTLVQAALVLRVQLHTDDELAAVTV